MLINQENVKDLAWQKMDGLIPAIIQHAATGAILMQGYMNQASLTATLDTGKATFFSRSKQALWVKGETSGNFLNVEQVLTDCDQDSLLIACTPIGPSCHLGTESCFPEQKLTTQNFLSQLEQVIASRKGDDPKESYTAHLFSRGTTKMAQKVGEEGVEVALAAVAETKEDLLGECADLFYHTLVLLADQKINLSEVMAVLQQRHNK
ncbi:bifunctional phosphoribosyl-AMP cyclohydrolase/phosphoribosyl-ATP diphosphatase HisIE [Colwellia sp. 1_MG-2023]|jgi:phosphoribosyl-ATP pyrophosphohydrolase/phosphoribosyl-AMP cyclohydrolase|uniref:bifunctional phosphoribosyl-AMP cyclohydrolase/phosphoribosyl-ATP diphosphatase HisIE n=1 Tax=unclassified Colwellia TaxID=196834 RepID=UPI001C084234|nr:MULTISPECIES: bifunctional phosphoribosyl-AMP cyclohydrolase/phosphoribosyl-ATP diphosphatase HisIE [unclassified Colwellia]MBU2925642.1 bifunctional phosphoribosyl-AMP cyclohydrolase/phosphoribosyl-ATP diphosphatase HisIE [Colwellia sp. C2M11]MDO6489365.1 bifunctional phosphoribosyl-AMP cyclohydrolase/phosphoribosyl-ATP diphosphatase HisIE [Colwellia sp. 6_MG-2023]MDO6651132.1 bifunctional phosphoribosyl-AMP cyclohydrolase/phosphoribosyl-ATP diphosphatase HisIE [Colwellia sp. 3_MG-2023]MDO6